MLDVSHQERAIEMNGSSWKLVGIIEEAGTDKLDVDRFDLPVRREKFKTITTIWILCRRITH